MRARERKMGWRGDGRRAGEKRRERERKKRGWGWWRAKSKLANHETESAYVTGEGEAAGNVMKLSQNAPGHLFPKTSSHFQLPSPRQ